MGYKWDIQWLYIYIIKYAIQYGNPLINWLTKVLASLLGRSSLGLPRRVSSRWFSYQTMRVLTCFNQPIGTDPTILAWTDWQNSMVNVVDILSLSLLIEHHESNFSLLLLFCATLSQRGDMPRRPYHTCDHFGGSSRALRGLLDDHIYLPDPWQWNLMCGWFANYFLLKQKGNSSCQVCFIQLPSKSSKNNSKETVKSLSEPGEANPMQVWWISEIHFFLFMPLYLVILLQ